MEGMEQMTLGDSVYQQYISYVPLLAKHPPML